LNACGSKLLCKLIFFSFFPLLIQKIPGWFTDVELDLSNDRELGHRADFAEYIPLQEMLQKQSAAIFERR